MQTYRQHRNRPGAKIKRRATDRTGEWIVRNAGLGPLALYQTQWAMSFGLTYEQIRYVLVKEGLTGKSEYTRRK